LSSSSAATWSLIGLSLLVVTLLVAAFFGAVLGGNALALMGVSLAVFLSGIGSTVGVGVAGEKGAGIVTEDPEKFGRLLLLQAIPGTQGVYGFLAGFLAIFRMGAFSGTLTLSVQQGWQFIFACLPVGIACLISGFWQAKVAIAGMDIVAKHPEESGRALVLPAMVETYAVLGLLASVLMIMFAVKV